MFIFLKVPRGEGGGEGKTHNTPLRCSNGKFKQQVTFSEFILKMEYKKNKQGKIICSVEIMQEWNR